ncbi:MAG TPA: glycosyltransferase [Mucilaginibacter sp.]|nr:glycosyltransferase [Mucilaginibacter sp.]
MSYLNDILYCLSLVVFIFLAFQSLYLFVFSIAGKVLPARKYPKSEKLASFAIYIPSYKEDAVIVDTVMAAITLNYPAHKRKVIVIADSLQPETLAKLRMLPIQLVEVSFEKSTKAKALNEALRQTESEFDYALVLDADNICAPDFLLKMNDAVQTGYRVIQGQRVAKNTDTMFALLDAVSEGINNHIFRKGHCALGLSSAIIGSGMALEFNLFKEIMPEITAVGGFDKEMELRLLRKNIRFGYAEDALIYDEKTSKKGTFENQRRRWLSAQHHYMKKYIGDGFLQLLLKGNIDFFDKVMQTILLPRILLLGILPVVFILSLVFEPSVQSVYWLLIWAVAYASILAAVPGKYYSRQLFKAILSLPGAFLTMFKLVFKLRNANKSFIHTPHGEVK